MKENVNQFFIRICHGVHVTQSPAQHTTTCVVFLLHVRLGSPPILSPKTPTCMTKLKCFMGHANSDQTHKLQWGVSCYNNRYSLRFILRPLKRHTFILFALAPLELSKNDQLRTGPPMLITQVKRSGLVDQTVPKVYLI